MARLLSLLAVAATLAACQSRASGASGFDPTPCTQQVAFEANDSALSAEARQSIDRTYGSGSYCAQAFGVGKSFDLIVLRTNASAASRTRAEAVRDYLVALGFPAASLQLVSDGGARPGVTIEFWPHALWRMRRTAFDLPG